MTLGFLALGVSGGAVAAATGGAQVAWMAAQVAQSWPSRGQPEPLMPQTVQQAPSPTGPSTPAPLYPQAAAPVADPFSYTIAQWRQLQQSDGLPFATYANFMLAHPGWPGENSRRSAAEARPDAGQSPALTVRFFDRFPPLSGAGHLRYAEALAATGQSGRAAEQARLGWRKGALRSADEASVLGRFAAALSPQDHDARMDMLLWQGQTTLAQRQLAWTSSQRRAIFEARLAYRTNAPDAAARGAAVEAVAMGDAGFLADRATWLRNAGAGPTARTQLARPHSLTFRPSAPEKWFEVLLTHARGAAADRQYQLAYDIARQVDDAYPPATDVSTRPLGERDDYTSLVWLAGTTALQDMGRPRDAVGMFERYSRGSRTPTTQSKGLYWAGRAAEAAGDATAADDFFRRAAAFSDLYYGQLAAERIRQPLRGPAPVSAAAIDPGMRTAFFNREVVRAARLLGQQGQTREQSLFIRQIAQDAKTDTDHALANELAVSISRPDLGVLVGKSALQNGLNDYTAAGYPSVRVPAAAQDNWTMVHAIARQESMFDRNAVSHAGARGIMQLMPGTARETAGKLGLSYNPGSLNSDTDYNIQLGSHYFQRMHALYGSYPLALAAYNAGPGNVNRWLRANGDPRTPDVDIVRWVEDIPIFETKNYVQRVLENAVVYDLMHPARARSRGPNNLSWYLGKNRPG